MTTRITGTLNPWGPVSQANRVRSYQSGRVCSHPECGTILSIYNASKYCSMHAALAAGGRRRGTPRPIREVACEQCGTVFEPATRRASTAATGAGWQPLRGASVLIRAENLLQKTQALQAVAPAPDERTPIGSAA